MATTLLGHIESFDPATDDWTQYVERMEEMFKANDLTGEDKATKRSAIFLSVVGKRTYSLLRSLMAPEKPSTKTFEELTARLTAHFSPAPSEVMQRFRFHSRNRKPGESVSEFVAELRKLSEHCNFGDGLEKALRDRIVGGINDETMQRKLLIEQGLTYKKAVTLAQGIETTDANFREMKQPHQPVAIKTEPVNRVQRDSGIKFPKKQEACYRCGADGHLANACMFKDRYCNYCKKKGHIAKVCRNRLGSGEKRPRKKVHHVDEEPEDTGSENELIQTVISSVTKPKEKAPPVVVRMCINGMTVDMEVDTGASVSLMSVDKYKCLFPDSVLDKTDVKLQTYLGEVISVVGSTVVHVEYEGQKFDLPLVIVKGNGPTLLGRDWLQTGVKLNWHDIYYTRPSKLLDMLDKYKSVFDEGLGEFKDYEVQLEVDPTAKPRFSKARTVPYAMRKGVEEEIDRLVAEGTLEPVEYSDWAAPIVAVLKSDKKTIRLCGDFRTTINPVSKLHRYPIPRIEDLFAGLGQGKTFSTVDLRQAYQQMKVDTRSRQYLVINTHRGLFRYTRLPYGVSSAPGIFQKAMEQLLRGIPGVVVYIDDILVTGENDAQHLHSLEEVLKRLSQAGLRAKKHKCAFMQARVTFLGHVIDQQGLHPIPSKVKAIHDAPVPSNAGELKSYLGLLTYYSKFLPNLSSQLVPLYHLLKHSTKWTWAEEQERAFKESKKLLTSSTLLVHFDPTLPIVLACDASQYGVGAVLAHKMHDGSERPIGYVSRTLNDAERNYAQLEKEALSIVFGVKRFYSYLFGHKFTIITDHKPLLGLLSECKSTSPQASARVKRWALYLSMFEYSLRFRNTTAHANADALSRLPLPDKPDQHFQPTELVLLVTHLENAPVTADQIAEATRRDPVLSTVSQFVHQGWPHSVPNQPQISSYFDKRNELSLFEGCLLWGSRVVVPDACQDAVLEQLHEGHQGMVRTKSFARMYVWWPGMNKDIDRIIRQCESCQKTRSDPSEAPLHSWSWPSRPWARVHLDYAGPVEGKMVLIIVDAHSKWIEAIHTSTATSTAVIEACQEKFAQFGVPETVVTDNGTCFTSQEFAQFLQSNGITHITTAPYHPASNGMAERSVQIVKNGLKKNKEGSFRCRLSKTLLAHRLTPHATTGKTPCELLLGRRVRTRLDLLRPNTADRVEKMQSKQKKHHDNTRKLRTFQVGALVFVRDTRAAVKWIPGTVLRMMGNVSYSVRLENDGRIRKCHIDQLRPREKRLQVILPSVSRSNVEMPTSQPTVEAEGEENPENVPEEPPAESPVLTPDPVITRRDTLRTNRQPVDRYDPSFK